jgi:hypothetical protein
VPEAFAERFGAALVGVPWAWIGTVRDDAVLEIAGTAAPPAAVPVADLARAWRGGEN